MKLRGFSVIEIIVVLAIALTVTAIGLPVFVQAKKRANVVVNVAKLKQLHLATMIYRSDYDGDAIYGSLGSMGLPPVDYVYRREPAGYIKELGWGSLVSSCGVHPSYPPHPFSIHYYPGEGGGEFPEDALIYRENLLLFFDMNCTDSDVALGNPYLTMYGIGVLLSGQIVFRRRKGVEEDLSFWTEPVN